MKKKKAQELIEFLLVVPFMVIILGILTEYAYALNVNMTLNEGLKTVSSSIYSQIYPGMSEDKIKTALNQNFKTYLDENNVPTEKENDINVSYVINGQTAILMARYTYIPAFTLPNIYFKFLPDKLNFLSTAAVPAAFFGNNSYPNTDSRTLDKIWSTTSNFSSQDSFNDSKKGFMKNVGGGNNVIFLVSSATTNPQPAPGLGKPYVLIDWKGDIIKNSGGKNYAVDANTGNLYTCNTSAPIVCTNANQTLINYAATNNTYNIIFIHDSEANNINNLKTYWIRPSESTNLSDTSVDGVLKRALALINASNQSIGNYDNLNVYEKTYNPDISQSRPYIVGNYGSMVFVSASMDNIEVIKTGSLPVCTYNNSDFGSKVN